MAYKTYPDYDYGDNGFRLSAACNVRILRDEAYYLVPVVCHHMYQIDKKELQLTEFLHKFHTYCYRVKELYIIPENIIDPFTGMKIETRDEDQRTERERLRIMY